MSHFLRLAIAVPLLAVALWGHRLAFPGDALACMCAVQPGAPVFSGREDAVFIGTAIELRPDGNVRFAVERWFVGGTPFTREILVFSGSQPVPGGQMTSSCSVMIEVGDRMIIAARLSDGVYQPGACAPHAAMASDEGTRLLHAAVASFGQGMSPGQAPDARDTMPDDPSPVGFVIGIAGILVLVIVIAVLGAARQRPEDAPTS